MNAFPVQENDLSVRAVAKRASAAARRLAVLPDQRRNEILHRAADQISARATEILRANELDCAAAKTAVANGQMSQSMFARLETSRQGIEKMSAGVRAVAALPDPLNRRLAATELDENLTLYKESCPIGVLGIVFESRPAVIPQVVSLAVKSGNAVLLKGGSEAAQTNQILFQIWRDVLADCHDAGVDAVNLLHTRADVQEMLALDEWIDLIVPRGSKEFVRAVNEQSRIPVLGHGAGVCHVYVDQFADVNKARRIVFDSKVDYPSACNAVETLLVHKKIAAEFLPETGAQLQTAGVEIRGCPHTIQLLDLKTVVPATETDWEIEYSDLIIAVKIVDNLDEAIEHINLYGSKHTESIVTEDEPAAQYFMQQIDAASVFHNASTRFADGFRFGFGAEIGISTGKLHARGPVGLEGLTTYKFKLFGDGHTARDYSRGAKTFSHRRLF